MTDADVINPQHFESDPADIRIQIQINPEIQILIPDLTDHFWLRLDTLAEVCAEHSLVMFLLSAC